MSDFDPQKKLAGVPIYLWIGGGVIASYMVIKWRQNKQAPTVSDTPQTALDYGSSGGSGLASDSPYGAPAGIGITAPTPSPTNPVPVYVVPNPQTPTTTVKTPVPPVVQKPPAKTVSENTKTVTTKHPSTKRGYTQAQLEAAKKRKQQEAADAKKTAIKQTNKVTGLRA